MSRLDSLYDALEQADANGEIEDATQIAQMIREEIAFQETGAEGSMAAEVKGESSFLDKAKGVGEAALSVISGATAGLAAGAAGALGGIAKEVMEGEFGTPDAARRIQQRSQESSEMATYSPRTEKGREYLGDVGEVVEDTGISALPPVIPSRAPVAAAQQAVKGAGAKGLASLVEKGSSLPKGTQKTQIRRNITKLDEELDKLNQTKRDLVDQEAVLKSSPKAPQTQAQLEDLNTRINKLNTEIKGKERQVLKEVGKGDSQVKATQDLLDLRLKADDAAMLRAELKNKLNSKLDEVRKTNKRVDTIADVVDAGTLVVGGLLTGTAPASVLAAVVKKGVIDKILKNQGVKFSIAEFGINRLNQLKTGLGKASKLSGKAIDKLSLGVSRNLDKLPERYQKGFKSLSGSPESIAVLHYFLLTQDPSYRKVMEPIVKEEGSSLMFNKRN